MGVLFRELSMTYGSLVRGRRPRLEPACSYRNFAKDLKTRLDDTAVDHISFWKKYLAGADHDVAPEYDDVAGLTSNAAVLPIAIARPSIDALASRLRRDGARATVFVALQACFGLAFGHAADRRRDLVIATDAANRSRPGMENLVGLVVNQVPLRIRFDPGEPIDDLLDRLDRELRDVLDHAEFPFGQIVRALNPRRRFGRMPLVRAKIVLQPRSVPLSLEGSEVTELFVENGESKFDLLVSLAETERDGFRGRLEYRTDVMDERRPKAVLSGFQVAIDAVAAGAKSVADVESAIDEVLRHSGEVAATDFDVARQTRLASLRGRRGRSYGGIDRANL
jgi:non-ribosomal peptide synthetase component F